MCVCVGIHSLPSFLQSPSFSHPHPVKLNYARLIKGVDLAWPTQKTSRAPGSPEAVGKGGII